MKLPAALLASLAAATLVANADAKEKQCRDKNGKTTPCVITTTKTPDPKVVEPQKALVEPPGKEPEEDPCPACGKG